MSTPRLNRRRVAVAVLGLAIVAALVVGLLEGGDGSSATPASDAPSLAQARRDVRDAPPPLSRLYATGDQLLAQSGDEFTAYLARLRGYPVVINKWAAWCGPCRREFPILRRASARYGTRVAFLGLNGDDDRAKAAAFLRGQPTLYPHVLDPDQQLARAMGAGVAYPSTIFLDRKGAVVNVYAGAYPSSARLDQDLRRYAGIAAEPGPGDAKPRSAADQTTEPEPAR